MCSAGQRVINSDPVLRLIQLNRCSVNKHAVGGRPPRYAPPLSSPWALKRLALPSRRKRSSSLPRPTRSHTHRCSRLTRQHGGDQSGLVTLTFDLESGVRVTCDVGYLCANFGLPRPLCSRVIPDVRDTTHRQIDVRQHPRLMPRLGEQGHNNRIHIAPCGRNFRGPGARQV